VFAPLGPETRRIVDRSERWWKAWSSKMTYQGPDRDAVLRSALALKLLVFAPSGAIVAAPTTSLPEQLGGSLNWDYRFCWLRDAALTIRALLGLGFEDEAEAFMNWLLHTTRLTRPRLRILYDVFGGDPPRERDLEHLPGYADSRPVRVGNLAVEQLQLDVYGEVIDGLVHFLEAGGVLDRETGRLLVDFGKYVCRNWNQPDEGIWEPRSGRSPHTHSRLLCWTALDRLIDLHSKGHLSSAPLGDFVSSRDEIRRDIETRAWNDKLGSYASVLDGDELDASLLLIPWYGFEPASTPRMRRTYLKIREVLGAPGGLLYRHLRPEALKEGAFGITSFWGAECVALGAGSLEEAEDLFRMLLGHANDLGLYAEEIDPSSGEALGNFPQGFTHVGLINAALSIDRRRKGMTPIPHEVGPRTRGASETEKHL
jgi:GH15 family glucan-1,4-alpha-glucosidase